MGIFTPNPITVKSKITLDVSGELKRVENDTKFLVYIHAKLRNNAKLPVSVQKNISILASTTRSDLDVSLNKYKEANRSISKETNSNTSESVITSRNPAAKIINNA